MSTAPGRREVYRLVNGKNTAADIAKKTKRHVNNVRRDLKMMTDAGLIVPKTDAGGNPVKKDGFALYDKIPLARTVPPKYFEPSAERPAKARGAIRVSRPPKSARSLKYQPLPLPTGQEILDICKEGEDQAHEFKGQGTNVSNIVREIGAMLNTERGGMILYGVDDEGTIEGAGVARQKFDPPLQNSLKDLIEPAATVGLHSVKVLGSDVLVIIVPPWNRRDVYHHNGLVRLRKGTTVCSAKPEESKRLHKGECVI